MFRNEPPLLGIDGLALLGERHAAHFLIGEFARERLALFAEFVELALRAGNVLARRLVALLNAGLLGIRVRAFALDLFEVFAQLCALVFQFALLLLAVFHVPADDVQLLRLLGGGDFTGVHRVAERVHLNVALEDLLLVLAQE